MVLPGTCSHVWFRFIEMSLSPRRDPYQHDLSDHTVSSALNFEPLSSSDLLSMTDICGARELIDILSAAPPAYECTSFAT